MLGRLRNWAAAEYHESSEWLGPSASGQNSQFSHIDFLRANWDQITGGCSIIKTHSDRDLFDFRYPKATVAYVLRDPALSQVGPHEGFSLAPRKGVIGDWRNHLTANDEGLVRDAVERASLDWGAVTWRE